MQVTLAPGTTLGRYQILEPLGQGGMATVYKALHPALERIVALKVIRAGFAEDPEFLERFTREARAVARLVHPSIVQVFDFDQDGGRYFMAMQHLEGGTLKDKLVGASGRGRLPRAEVHRVTNDVAQALGYAHRRGIVHRDVKPSNVLFDAEGRGVVSDFGIAKILGGAQLTQTGVGIGTPEYMSPEQAQGLPVDERSDLYSLAVMAYEMLLGRVPYTADTPMAVIFAHVRDPLPLPSSLDPRVGLATERTLMRALAKDPSARYATAPDFADALRAAIAEDDGGTLPTVIVRPTPATILVSDAPRPAIGMPRPRAPAIALPRLSLPRPHLRRMGQTLASPFSGAARLLLPGLTRRVVLAAMVLIAIAGSAVGATAVLSVAGRAEPSVSATPLPSPTVTTQAAATPSPPSPSPAATTAALATTEPSPSPSPSALPSPTATATATTAPTSTPSPTSAPTPTPLPTSTPTPAATPSPTPAPTPTPAVARGPIVYAVTFDGTSGTFAQTTQAGSGVGEIRYQPGSADFVVTSGQLSLMATLNMAPRATYVGELDFTVTSGTDGYLMWQVRTAPGGKSQGLLTLSVDLKSGRVRLYHWSPASGFSDLIVGNVSIVAGRTGTLTLRAEQTAFAVFYNGQSLGQATDSRLANALTPELSFSTYEGGFGTRGGGTLRLQGARFYALP